MKAFEEQYTAWVDGQLSGKELEKFERELAGREGGVDAARKDRAGCIRMKDFLKNHGRVPELEFPEVFNRQVLERIEKESVPERVFSWRFGWLVWAGVGCLAVAAGLYQVLIPTQQPFQGGQGGQGGYWAEVKSVRVADPSLWAESVCPPGEEVTLIWIEGLDYLPESYALR